MKGQTILQKQGHTPVTTSDCLLNGETIAGVVTKERGTHGLYKAIAITLEDNAIAQDDNLEAQLLDKETVKEIAFTADILFTDFGCEVHSHDMKNTYPFNKLKIIKLSAL